MAIPQQRQRFRANVDAWSCPQMACLYDLSSVLGIDFDAAGELRQ